MSFTVVQVDVSQRGALKYTKSIVIVLVILFFGNLALAGRAVLCQLQAYAILTVFVAALALYAYYEFEKRTKTVRTMAGAYCVDCKDYSRHVLVTGKRIGEESSWYERMHPSTPRLFLAVFVWVAWVAYGSLFHEATHTAVEDAFVKRWLEPVLHTSITFAYLRALRVVLLFINACVAALRNGLAAVTTIIFFVALFFPTTESTPQMLSFADLVSRTHCFVALFFVAEYVANASHYRSFVRYFDQPVGFHISALLMATNGARKMAFNEGVTLKSCTTTPTVQTFNVIGYLVTWSTLIQSAWVLVANDFAVIFAYIQLIFYFLWLIDIRSDTKRFIEKNENLTLKAPDARAAKEKAGSPRELENNSGARKKNPKKQKRQHTDTTVLSTTSCSPTPDHQSFLEAAERHYQPNNINSAASITI